MTASIPPNGMTNSILPIEVSPSRDLTVRWQDEWKGI